MFRKTLFVILWSILVIVSPSSLAQLEIQLTRAIDAAKPIAIIPFYNESLISDKQGTLTSLIKADLQNSGQFRVVTPSAMKLKPVNATNIDKNYWKKQGVNYVLVGQLQPAAHHHYKISYQLVDLYHTASHDPMDTSALVSQSIDMNTDHFRDVAHHISDTIYENIEGVRGVFSTKLAYVLVSRTLNQSRSYKLMVADADGYDAKAILTSAMPIMSPAWAPDGQHISYVSFEGSKATIFLQNISNGKREVVSQFPGVNGAPAISPDGKRIALVLTKTGNPKIYVVDRATQAISQITRGYSIDTEPAWSSDGRSLLFTSSRGGNPQIYRYLFDNNQIERLTFEGDYNARASFSPDMKNIVMMHRGNGLFSIALQDLTSGRVHILAQSGVDESPSLAPNGKMVLYATQYGGRSVLSVVSTDGFVKLRLPAQAGDVQEPAWSPFLT